HRQSPPGCSSRRNDSRRTDSHDGGYDQSLCASGLKVYGADDRRHPGSKSPALTSDSARSRWVRRGYLYCWNYGSVLCLVRTTLTEFVAGALLFRPGWVCYGNWYSPFGGLQRSRTPGSGDFRGRDVRHRTFLVL